MKQIIALALLGLIGILGYNSYETFYKKKIRSTYDSILSSKGISIKPIVFDKDKIEKLNKSIQSLKQDKIYKLQLGTIRGNGSQPLFIDNYNKIYDKILLQQRLTNNYQ